MGLITPSFEVPDFQSGSSAVSRVQEAGVLASKFFREQEIKKPADLPQAFLLFHLFIYATKLLAMHRYIRAARRYMNMQSML